MDDFLLFGSVELDTGVQYDFFQIPVVHIFRDYVKRVLIIRHAQKLDLLRCIRYWDGEFWTKFQFR